MENVYEGGCICGAVRYRVRGKPAITAACHCRFTHTAELRPGMRAIALGTLDEPDALKIERHIWLRSKRPWVSIPPDVQTFPKGSVIRAAKDG
jgi:hypothetical protein